MGKVKESFSKTYVNVKEKWTGIAGRTRVVILAAVGVVLVSAIVITAVLNRPQHDILTTAATAAEATQIQQVLAGASPPITDVQVTRNHDIIVPSSDKTRAWVALNEAGLPSRGQNNDIWNTGVGMFSTETQMRETQKQQLQQNIMDYLSEIPQVRSSRVILYIPKTKNYVMVENREESSASVAVTLEPGQVLTRTQIDGIHRFVQTAVPGLKAENITVNDGGAIPLIASGDGLSPGEEFAIESQKLAWQAGFKMLLADNLKAQVTPMLDTVYGPGNYALSVNAVLEFSEGATVEEVQYTPVVGDTSGIIRDIVTQYGAGGQAGEGGVVGNFPNADIAPGYPTLYEIMAGEEFYQEFLQTINYEINERRTFFNDNGLRIASITASLVVNSEPLLQPREDAWRQIIANGIGTPLENVVVDAMVFPLQATPGPGGQGAARDTTRDVFIFVLIAGALVVILAFMGLMTSGRKKRQIRYRGAVPAGDGMGGYLRDDTFQPMHPEPESFDLPSLLDENETKDVVLKREIKEFSKSNPEIIAQLIRTWFREDEP
jgi:flagellar M-ring protein FliF